MKALSLSQLMNVMHRALRGVVDPFPSTKDQNRLREYFEHRCCYCGSDAKSPHGHIDHADPRAGNHLGNLVLACAVCNGNNKRELHWVEYLAEMKTITPEERAARTEKITSWINEHPPKRDGQTNEVKQAVADAERALTEFATAYRKLKNAVEKAE